MKQVELCSFKTRRNFSNGNDNRELRLRADERRKLKEFNYKFHNNVSKIDEYEKKNQHIKD
jgi:hypothetical protein